MIIESLSEFDKILAIINNLIDTEPELGSVEGQCLDIFTDAVVKFEKIYNPEFFENEE